MGNASARDWDPIIGKRFNPLETVNTHSAFSQGTKEELSVSTRQTKDNKATKTDL